MAIGPRFGRMRRWRNAWCFGRYWISRVNPVDEKLRRRPDAKLGGDVSGVKMSQEIDFARNGRSGKARGTAGQCPFAGCRERDVQIL